MGKTIPLRPSRKVVLLVVLCCVQIIAWGQYWQQQVDYVIDVRLHDREKTLDAFEKISYTNHSPDTLTYIWFHLWPNAYKNDRTAFSEQLLGNGNTKFYFSNKDQRGYINRLDFKVDGITAMTEDDPQYIDVVKLVLPKPLLPGKTIMITTPFHEKLPFNFSRGGYDKNSFQVTQWYPKPAVYDRKGWHPMPYLDQGEFYSEFGNFEVHITVPDSYIVAATGELEEEIGPESPEEHETNVKLKKPRTNIPTIRITGPSPKERQVAKNYKLKGLNEKPKAAQNKTLETGTKSYLFRQENIHDFAWFANKRFIVRADTCALPSGKIVRVATYSTEAGKEAWKNSLQYAKDALVFYSKQVGDYPYNVLRVIQGPASSSGGMEYPTITLISPTPTAEDLDETMAHEIGHNWFYGALASNERTHPWMDEGINTFYEYRYEAEKYGRQSQEMEVFFQTKALRKTDQPIETPSADFSNVNYNMVAYHKTAVWLAMIEGRLGKETFQKMMQQYYKQWSNKHPYPEDLEAVVRQYMGQATDSVFALQHQKGLLPNEGAKGLKVVTPFTVNNYIKYPSKNMLMVSPAIGVNSYDKAMIGAIISNYKLPPNRLQFAIAPLYATGTKSLKGMGRINYTIMSNGWIRKTDLFVNGANFSMDEFRDSANRKINMSFRKLVPGIRFTFREKDPRSTVTKYIQWKTYLINEQSLRIVQDTATNGGDTALLLHYNLPGENRYINQLRLVYDNSRALYPYNINLQIEQAKDFVRPTLTAQYFFNYAEGGLQVRFFAGGLMYLHGRTLVNSFNNERYFLNMKGANGYEDYTYSDYFLGRNRFEGFVSQQIMIRDGGFKVGTDLLTYPDKVGVTDKWLTALNFNTTVPQHLNPLSALPMSIPLHLFLDVGTYGEAWNNRNANPRILYDAGFHIPLLRDVINIYIPILYSKVYGDYFKSTIPKNRFLHSITFSIDLYNKDLKKINHELEF